MTRPANSRILSCGGDGNQEGQEVNDCWEHDEHNDNKDKESSSGANKEQDGDDVDLPCLVIANQP